MKRLILLPLLLQASIAAAQSQKPEVPSYSESVGAEYVMLPVVVTDKKGHALPDPELRDSEDVPLKEDIHAFFEREVKPHVPEAWINRSAVDPKDGQGGKVGYEINFNRYFYRYQPPRPLEEIEAEIKVLEQEIVQTLREVTA